MSTRRRETSRVLRDSAGKVVCSCGCGRSPVKPRRNWYSQACVDDWMIRNDPGTVRRRVYQRDCGVCAICRRRGVQWEADHIVPVVEGGGQCGLENYRTLCIDCHKTATRALARRRAQARRPDPGPELPLFDRLAAA